MDKYCVVIFFFLDISPPRKKQSSSHRDVHEDDEDRMKNEGDKGVRRKYEGDNINFSQIPDYIEIFLSNNKSLFCKIICYFYNILDRYPPRKRNLSRGRDRHDHRAYKNDRGNKTDC